MKENSNLLKEFNQVNESLNELLQQTKEISEQVSIDLAPIRNDLLDACTYMNNVIKYSFNLINIEGE